MRMTRERFEELVVQEEQALMARLPRRLSEDAQDLLIEIADRPSADEFKAFVKSEMERYGEVVRRLGISIN